MGHFEVNNVHTWSMRQNHYSDEENSQRSIGAKSGLYGTYRSLSYTMKSIVVNVYSDRLESGKTL